MEILMTLKDAAIEAAATLLFFVGGFTVIVIVAKFIEGAVVNSKVAMRRFKNRKGASK